MATVSSSSNQRSRFSKLLLRSSEREREPPSPSGPAPPPPPPPPFKDLSPPASHSSRSLPRTSSPTSRFRRPPLPSVQPSNASFYSFTSSPSLQGGPNSPTLQEFEEEAKPLSSSSSSSHLSPTNRDVSSFARGLPPLPPPTITTTPAAPTTTGGGGSSHLKGKKSWTLLKRPGSSTNLSFRSVENEELQPQRYASSSLPPRSTSPGWNNGDGPILVPLSDEPKERAATLGRKSSNAQQLKRKGSRILKSASSTLLGVMGGGGGGVGGGGGAEEGTGSPRELVESRRRKNSSTSENGVLLKAREFEDDGGIGMPFNVHHELHLESDDLSALPQEWVELLRAQGLSTTELLRLAKDKSKSQLARAAALNIPISPSSTSIRSLTSSPTKPVVPSTPPQLPPFSHTFLTTESPPAPPPPPPPRPDFATKGSRLSLQLREFRGIDVFPREETDGDWAQGLLSAALGGGGGESSSAVAAAASDSGSSRAGANLVASPSEDRPPLTPREQRSSRLAKKGAGRRPSDPPSAGEGGEATSRSTSPKTSSTFSHGASSSGGTNHHPITPLPPPGSYVPPTRKDSRPDAQRSSSVSSFGSSTEGAAPAIRIPTASRPPPSISPSVPLPTISPVSRSLPLLPAPLLTTGRPLPSVPVESPPSPPRPTTPPTHSPPRAIPTRKISTSSSTDGDEPRSNTFGTLSGKLQGGRRSPNAFLRREDAPEETAGRRNGQREETDFSDEEGRGPAYLDEFGAGGSSVENQGGTFGRVSHPNNPLQRTPSNSSQTSTTSLVPSLNGDASIPASHSNSSIHRRPSLGMRSSSSYNSMKASNLDSRLSVMTAATGTSRVTSLSPSMISSGSHLSMDEEAVITQAFLIPSSSSASATTTQFASTSMTRPTKPVRLFLGGSNGSSRGTTSSPPPPNQPHLTKLSSSDVPKTLPSAGSQQSMFEEAELALDEAVKMLNSPKKYQDSPTRRGGGGVAEEEEHPVTPGTPAYSDFLHQFGSDDEDGLEQDVVIQRRRP